MRWWSHHFNTSITIYREEVYKKIPSVYTERGMEGPTSKPPQHCIKPSGWGPFAMTILIPLSVYIEGGIKDLFKYLVILLCIYREGINF